MLMYVMFIGFVSNVFLPTFDKFGRHCTGNCVWVGSLDSGALSTESCGSLHTCMFENKLCLQNVFSKHCFAMFLKAPEAGNIICIS